MFYKGNNYFIKKYLITQNEVKYQFSVGTIIYLNFIPSPSQIAWQTDRPAIAIPYTFDLVTIWSLLHF